MSLWLFGTQQQPNNPTVIVVIWNAAAA